MFANIPVPLQEKLSSTQKTITRPIHHFFFQWHIISGLSCLFITKIFIV
jgi:hypothetical protein